MPRKKDESSSKFCKYVDDFDDDMSSNGSQPPIQRNAANARERARMRILSNAFCRLKTKLPWVPADTKLSKLDTLRLATIYIQQLSSVLAGEPLQPSIKSLNPQYLTWPFSFQHQPDLPNNCKG